MVDEIKEFDKFHPTEDEFALINKYTNGNINREDLFVIKRKACNNKVDKSDEEFQDKAIKTMSEKILGTPAIKNHNRWSVDSIWGKNFDSIIVTDKTEKGRFGRTNDPVLKYLQVSQYTVRSEGNKELRLRLISNIEDDVSVCFTWEIENMKCSICNQNIFSYDFELRQWECPHLPGKIYDNEKCFVKIMDIKDFYELSNVVIGAQYDIGTIFESKSLEEGIKEYQESNEVIKKGEWDNHLRQKYIDFKAKTMRSTMKNKETDKTKEKNKDEENQDDKENNLETPEKREDKLFAKELNEVKKTVNELESEVNKKLKNIDDKINELISLSENVAELSKDVKNFKEVEETLKKMDEKYKEIEKSNSKLNEDLENLKTTKFGNKTILKDVEENNEENNDNDNELIKAAKDLLQN